MTVTATHPDQPVKTNLHGKYAGQPREIPSPLGTENIEKLKPGRFSAAC